MWEASREEERKIPWKDVNEGSQISEEQYQEGFWRRRLDGIGLDTETKEFLAIEFKRTQDARSNYVERATVAQEQYKSRRYIYIGGILRLPKRVAKMLLMCCECVANVFVYVHVYTYIGEILRLPECWQVICICTYIYS